MVICFNSCVLSSKYWIIQPHGPRVNHNQNAAVTLIISYKACIGIVVWHGSLPCHNHTRSFILAPGPTTADLCNSHDSCLAEDTLALSWGDKTRCITCTNSIRSVCPVLPFISVQSQYLLNMLCGKLGSPGFENGLCEQPGPSAEWEVADLCPSPPVCCWVPYQRLALLIWQLELFASPILSKWSGLA